MSRKESSDALKGVMAAMRRSDLDEETQKRLEHELEELRSRVRTAS
jgi:predicted nucleotide-binding protein